MAFDNIPRPTDWLDFIDPRAGRSNGLQGAHPYSKAEWAAGSQSMPYHTIIYLGFFDTGFFQTLP